MTMRIDPDGTVTQLTVTLIDAGRAEFDYTSVVTCACPILPESETWVAVIDDFGAQDAAINRKAWALYGRSPIYGTVFVGRDGDRPYAPALADLIARPLDEWGLPEFALTRLLNADPPRPDMLVPRPEQS